MLRLAKDARVRAKLLNIGATTDNAGKPDIAPTSLGTYITEPGNISVEVFLNHYFQMKGYEQKRCQQDRQ